MRVSVSLPFAVLMFTIACSSSNNKNGAGAETASSTGSSGNGSGSGGSGTSASSATGSNSTGAGAPSVPVDNPVVDPDQPCGLDDAAFCEQFETASPGGRGGPLDETRWAFSRYGHLPTQFFVREPASTESGFDAPATFCGQPFSNLMPGQDVEFCDGPSVGGGTSSQLNEVFNDQGDFGYNSMMIRQPFDFTGRTGTIVLDVDAKFNPHNLGHGWWVEFWITEDPTPMPYHGAPTVYAIPKNGVGFAFFGFGSCGKENWINTLDEVTVAHEYEIVHSFKDFDYPSGFDGRCFRTSDGILNHFELRISKTVPSSS